MQVFIVEEDYDKAIKLLKNYENQINLRVAVDGKSADKVMLKYFVVFICIAVVLIYFWGNNKGLW